jgi:5-methylcytosine-specific restriction endonuclease McrA
MSAQAKAPSARTGRAFYQQSTKQEMTMSKRNTSTSAFFAKYKHPNWQKKRLEVMEKADFECENCGDKDATLNVHHRFYVSGRDPWEYDVDELVCLCEDCHKYQHTKDERLKASLNKYKTCSYIDPIDVLIGFIEGRMRHGPGELVHPTSGFWEYFSGFCMANGWDFKDTHAQRSQIIEMCQTFDGINVDAFDLYFCTEISKLRAEYLMEYGASECEEYPSWLRDHVENMVIKAINVEISA